MQKLKFYFLGFIPGLILVFFFLNQKGASCSGYLPSSRVVAEILSKNFTYSNEAKQAMAALNINDKFVKDSIIASGEIDFDKSNAQKRPCPEYLLISKKNKEKYQLFFIKCKEEVAIKELKRL